IFSPLPSNEADLFFQKPIFDETLTANTDFGGRMSMYEERWNRVAPSVALILRSERFGIEYFVGEGAFATFMR
ncbi:unnamed protein product, partial [Onchocerca ochengi]